MNKEENTDYMDHNADYMEQTAKRPGADSNTEEQVIKIKGNEAMIIKLFQDCIESENSPKEIWAVYDGYVFRTRLVRPSGD